MKFRKDINGLRGVAILFVMLFHFQIFGFSGGFIGVDIFFVISGFLISNIIINKLQYNQFSLRSFFIHRIRRIVPALFSMLFVCLLLGWWWLAPADYKELGKEVAYASLFISNHLFVHDSGYFAVESSSKLLLHTWTLGVEWQFYLLFPLFLLLIYRYWQRKVNFIILIITLSSFGLSTAGAYWRPEMAFFLLPSRAWEFMLGSLLVLHQRQITHSHWQHFLSFLGIMLLLSCTVLFDESMSYPGFWALVPTLGTTLIILTPGSLLSKIFTIKPLQHLGNISYSLYLWHWPLYVAFGFYLNNELSHPFLLGIITLSLFLAWISYRFVETPFQQKQEYWSNKRLAYFVCFGFLLLYPAGRWIQSTHGVANAYRLSAAVLSYAKGAEDRPAETDRCLFGEKTDFLSVDQFCHYPGDPMKTKIFLWGDSHADAIRDVVKHLAQKQQRQLITATISSCPPLLRGAVSSRTPEQCLAGNKAILQQIKATHRPSVLLAARWSTYLIGRNEKHSKNNDMIWSPDPNNNKNSMNESRHIALFKKTVIDTICLLRDSGAKVFVLEPIPEIGFGVPGALARKEMYGTNQELRVSKISYQKRNQQILSILAEAKSQCGVTLLSPQSLLCDKDYCQLEQKKHPLYFDDDHLSTRGASLLEPLLEQIVK